MIKRCLIAAFLLVLLTAVSSAQSLGLGLGIPKSVPSAGGYVGIGDLSLTGGPITWYYGGSATRRHTRATSPTSTARPILRSWRRWPAMQRLDRRHDRELPRHAQCLLELSHSPVYLRHADGVDAPRPSMSRAGRAVILET